MRTIILLIVILVIQGCSKKVSTPSCITTYRLDKLDKVSIHTNKYGGYDRENKRKAEKLIRGLRIVEDYYYWNSTPMNTKDK